MSRTLKACVSLFRIRVAENLQYRAAAIINSSTVIFWAILQAVLFTIVFTLGNPGETAMTLPMAISYAWLTQMMYGFVGHVDIDKELREKIISGNVALDLCRPLDLYAHWYSKTAANKFGSSAWRAVITLVAAMVVPAVIRLSPPSSVLGFALFVISLCTGMLISVAFAMLLSAVRVGLTWGEGPTYMFALMASVLSGSWFPLQLWPDFMQSVLLLQPFAGLMDIPFRLYLGLIPPHEGLWAIGLQLLWAVIIMAIGKVLLNRKISQLIVQGG